MSDTITDTRPATVKKSIWWILPLPLMMVLAGFALPLLWRPHPTMVALGLLVLIIGASIMLLSGPKLDDYRTGHTDRQSTPKAYYVGSVPAFVGLAVIVLSTMVEYDLTNWPDAASAGNTTTTSPPVTFDPTAPSTLDDLFTEEVLPTTTQPTSTAEPTTTSTPTPPPTVSTIPRISAPPTNTVKPTPPPTPPSTPQPTPAPRPPSVEPVYGVPSPVDQSPVDVITPVDPGDTIDDPVEPPS